MSNEGYLGNCVFLLANPKPSHQPTSNCDKKTNPRDSQTIAVRDTNNRLMVEQIASCNREDLHQPAPKDDHDAGFPHIATPAETTAAAVGWCVRPRPRRYLCSFPIADRLVREVCGRAEIAVDADAFL